MNPNWKDILTERLWRQRLTRPANTREEYLDLFRLLQPVSTIANTRPGDPPRLVHRADFDDSRLTSRLRAERTIVKGRFLGGNLAYVLADDLALYANAFQRPLPNLNMVQEMVLHAIRGAGPLTPRQLKEETGLLNKEIMPALHRLQQAFLVYEDQVSDDWERSWYEFAEEWPGVKLSPERQPAAAQEILRRFLQGHVFATFEQIKDWSQLPTALLRQATGDLTARRLVVPGAVDGLGEGWLCSEDKGLPERELISSTWMLHQSDILVQSHRSELKRRFAGLETLQYLLIDGRFQGAVVGHWRIGPHDVEDIVLTLPQPEIASRRDEIIAAVAQVYHPPHSHILKYAGEAL